MIIIYGENTVASRQKLVEVIDSQKQNNQEIIRFEAKRITEATLEEALGANDLFGTQKTIIIDELHSLPTSKKKKLLIKMCAQSGLHEVVLWEKRDLTKTMLKQFPSAQLFQYKISKTLFTWLDMLGTTGNSSKKLTLLHSAVSTDGEYFCFIMLIRQIRMMIQRKTGGRLKGAPFMIAKTSKQASRFTIDELLDTYKYLLKIDQSQKTSSSNLDTLQMLDLLTLKM